MFNQTETLIQFVYNIFSDISKLQAGSIALGFMKFLFGVRADSHYVTFPFRRGTSPFSKNFLMCN